MIICLINHTFCFFLPETITTHVIFQYTGSINFLNSTKENEVAVDAWQAITSVGGSRHLDL